MNQLEEALTLGKRLSDLDDTIKTQEEELDKIKKEYRRIEQEVLPEILEELGISSFTLTNGKTIKLYSFPSGRLTPETKEAAFRWLRENHHEGIIRNTFNIGLKQHEDAQADQLRDFLTERGLPYENKEDIHPATLKAFIKEQYETEGFPNDLFNIFEVKKVEFLG